MTVGVVSPDGPLADGVASAIRPVATKSLRQLAVRGAVWTIIGYGASLALRLVSSVVLTRLLFPEAFGVMALVNLFLQGLAMFSDLGTGPAVLRDPRGDDATFLNTAWTLQTLRGLGLAAAAAVIAWPVAAIYDNPSLMLLLPATAISTAIMGFQSTKLTQALRHMRLNAVTLQDLWENLAGTLVTITIVAVYRSVWALVFGAIIGAVCRVTLSHTLLPGVRNRFCLDAASARTLFHFGRWIFISSIVYFLAKRLDQFLLGAMMPLEMLGVYAIAVALAEVPVAVNMALVKRVMAPAVSRTFREEPHRVAAIVDRFRAKLDLLFLPAVGCLLGGGGLLVRILYDSRYQAAGWVLQALCVRVAMRCVLESGETVLVSCGKPQYVVAQNAARLVWIALGLPVGFHFWGLTGFVLAGALSELPTLPVIWFGLSRLGLLSLRRECLAATMFVGGAGVSTLIVSLL